jgi:retron-type reverse transcriptase
MGQIVAISEPCLILHMKRHGNLFADIVDINNIKEAVRKAKLGKSTRSNIRLFDRDIDGNLQRIQQSLIDKTFTTSKYQTKTIYEPKVRTIYILPFNPDRIVQHAVMNLVSPIWDKILISDSYACRRNKGIHAGSLRTSEFVRKYDYCLKCDVQKFYQSVNHNILFDIVQRKIKCSDTLWLLHDIIYSYPGDTNVPIGNYTSQWFGNLYLNELDVLVKHVFKIKGYVRYCDDFCLFHNDKRVLNTLAKQIKTFMADRLNLTLSKCDVFPVKHGVDFLGYRHFRDKILLRKSTAKRVFRKIKTLPSQLLSGHITETSFLSTLASFSGWIRWANTYNFRNIITC